MRRKIKKMDCIEYLSVQAPLEKVNMLEDKQSKYIHEFVKRKEYSIAGLFSKKYPYFLIISQLLIW